MKIYTVLGLMLMLLLAAPRALQAKEIKVKVNGMVCGFCAQGISKKFKENASVEKVDVNLGSKVVTLSTKGSADIDDVTINRILKDAGYNVENVERSL